MKLSDALRRADKAVQDTKSTIEAVAVVAVAALVVAVVSLAVALTVQFR